MADLLDTGKDITLIGESGQPYEGKIYSKSDTSSSFPIAAILCWMTSSDWENSIENISKTDKVKEEFDNFKGESRYTHLIVIPKNIVDFGRVDKIDDLRKKYIQDKSGS
jgi:hypothetical protein